MIARDDRRVGSIWMLDGPSKSVLENAEAVFDLVWLQDPHLAGKIANLNCLRTPIETERACARTSTGVEIDPRWQMAEPCSDSKGRVIHGQLADAVKRSDRSVDSLIQVIET
jgi:hypothetical protein